MINNPIPWPNGARCACVISFDMDADSTLHLTRPKDGFRYVSAISGFQYGPYVAIPRIIDSYKSFNIKQTFFILEIAVAITSVSSFLKLIVVPG